MRILLIKQSLDIELPFTNLFKSIKVERLAKEKLKHRSIEKLKKYLAKQKMWQKGRLEILLTVLKNEE